MVQPSKTDRVSNAVTRPCCKVPRLGRGDAARRQLQLVSGLLASPAWRRGRFLLAWLRARDLSGGHASIFFFAPPFVSDAHPLPHAPQANRSVGEHLCGWRRGWLPWRDARRPASARACAGWCTPAPKLRCGPPNPLQASQPRTVRNAYCGRVASKRHVTTHLLAAVLARNTLPPVRCAALVQGRAHVN